MNCPPLLLPEQDLVHMTTLYIEKDITTLAARIPNEIAIFRREGALVPEVEQEYATSLLRFNLRMKFLRVLVSFRKRSCDRTRRFLKFGRKSVTFLQWCGSILDEVPPVVTAL